MNEKYISIRKVNVVDVVYAHMIPVLHLHGLMVTITVFNSEGMPIDVRYHFVDVPKNVLRGIDAFQVFDILQELGSVEIIKEILEVKKYDFMAETVYVERVSKPPYYVDVKEDRYCLRLNP